MGLAERWLGVLVLVSLVRALAAAQLPVADVRIAGNERLSAVAIARATGIRAGQKPAREDLEGACDRRAAGGPPHAAQRPRHRILLPRRGTSSGKGQPARSDGGDQF